MFKHVDQLSKADQQALSKSAQKAAGKVLDIYNSTAKSRGEQVPPHVLRFLGFLKEKGLPGVKAALQAGGPLPAIVLALLAGRDESRSEED